MWSLFLMDSVYSFHPDLKRLGIWSLPGKFEWRQDLTFYSNWRAKILKEDRAGQFYTFNFSLLYNCTGGTLWHLQKETGIFNDLIMKP
jgi:hypothetical protein